MSYKPKNEILDKYANYLLETYIEPNASFPPNLWEDDDASVTRSTNACESFHSHFNSSFYNTHPSIYVFLEKIKEFQIDAYVKIHVLKPIKDKQVQIKLKTLAQLIARVQSRQMSRIDLVKCVSYYT